MNREYAQNSAQCRATQALLSDYVDNTLSARETWDVERHLAACRECADLQRQMQATVALLHTVDRFETGDDFMAKLHGRLDGLDPDPRRRRSPATALRDWLAGAQESLRMRRAPALSMGVALAGIAGIVLLAQPLLPRSIPTPDASAAIAAPQLRQALERQVAATANDPLGDAAAEKLTTHDGIVDEGADSLE